MDRTPHLHNRERLRERDWYSIRLAVHSGETSAARKPMTTPTTTFAGLALIAALVVAAIISVPASVQSGMPDISKLPPDQRRWVEDACPRSFGPSLYRSCVKRQLSALGAGIPNISKLPPDQRRWVEDACPRSFGPSLYRSCVKRQLGALGTSPSPSRRVPPPHLSR